LASCHSTKLGRARINPNHCPNQQGHPPNTKSLARLEASGTIVRTRSRSLHDALYCGTPMPSSSFNSLNLQHYLDRWQAGDREAADELLIATRARLEKLARRMTRSFPNIRDQADTSDVLQNSIIRLLHTLQRLRPGTTRDFFNLAAVHIRRELLDLARRCKGKPHVTLDLADDSDRPPPPQVAAPDCRSTEDFDLWVRFHEAVDELPVEEREVVGLVFYHGWTQVRIAELFNVDERTIRRRWSSACERLRALVGNDIANE
jgi:RNA polymerase sigma factor (sigma-70 family)